MEKRQVIVGVVTAGASDCHLECPYLEWNRVVGECLLFGLIERVAPGRGFVRHDDCRGFEVGR